jgi:septal ring factor EnvC (AmiA/AmiB activator)
MRKYFILLACLVVMSCKKAEETCCPEGAVQDSVIVASKDEPIEDSAVVKITETLQKSENVEENIKGVVEDRATLKVQNKKLTTELKTTKDSLEKVKFELKETKLKLPKKRNFLQKVLGVAKDSIEIKQIDTIQN